MNLHDRLMDRLRPGWRERREAQNPLWSMVEQLVVLLASGFLAFPATSRGIEIHFARFPADRERYGEGQPFLVIVECFLVWGFLWCLVAIVLNAFEARIPLLRRLSEQGSERFPELSARGANRALFKAACGIAAIALPLGLCLLLGPWT